MASLLKLNNLFKDDDEINLVIQYKTTGQIHTDVKDQNHFMRKFARFVINQQGKLVYRPLNLEVITNSRINQILEEEYTNPEVMGKSILTFHKYITSKYINIKRKHIKEFLENQNTYNITKPQTFRVNKPITSLYPNSLWAIDLIDMLYLSKSNYDYRYIINVVDVFSRKIWLEKIKFKTSKQIAESFRKIINRAGIQPDHLMMDNGTEFKGQFEDLCKELNIKIRHTRSYSPQANGIVETSNKAVRKLIRFLMVQNNTYRWSSFLDSIETNRNNTYNSSIKNTPNNIWTQTKEVIDPNINENTNAVTINKIKAQQNVVERFTRKKERYTDVYDNFDVGDIVRIKMATVFTNIRKMIKQTKTDKLIAVKYTPKLFVIATKTNPRTESLERRRYTLTDLNGEYVRLRNGTIKPFFGIDFQKVLPTETETTITTQRALDLNKIKPNKNDVDIGNLNHP
jgi:hypothetical protein